MEIEMTSFNQSDETFPPSDSLFMRMIRSLIEPPVLVNDIQQRHQVRLLASLLLILMLLGFLSAIIQLLIIPRFLPAFPVILGGLIVLLVAYLLCRTKYYVYAAILTAIIPSFVMFGSL